MRSSTKDYPKKVLLREDGPREGFQMNPEFVSTKKKLELIDALSKTGIQSIEVTSFVRPDRVPQHKDAELVAAKLVPVKGVRYRALYLNEIGLLRAKKCQNLSLEGYAMIAASESFLKKNNNVDLKQAIKGLRNWVRIFKREGLAFERLMLSTAFGDAIEGKVETKKVISILKKALSAIREEGGELGEVTIADTTGFANPESVTALVSEVKSLSPNLEVGLHLHDTRGLGLANVYAGLCSGVSRFDCSVGGLGGCPFVRGAAGNVATEEVAFLCQELGIQTGVDLEKYISCVRLAEKIVNRKLPGRLKTAKFV
jgi:hydroxymethylglutaryl-CoA lyase